MAPGTYGRTWWRDGYACGCMIQSVEQVIEPRLRAAGYLGPNEQVQVFQQAYSSGVEASAGTHGGGGALDHAKGSDGETIIWRECGAASWQRGPDHDYSFDDHNHSIWQGCPHLSGDAAGQLDQYAAGCNGLAGWGPDESPPVAPITWQAAFDKYAGTTPTDEGLLGMTEVIGMRRSDDWRIPAKTDGKWNTAFPLDDGGNATAVGGQHAMVTVTAALTISGLKDGEALDVAWTIVDCKSDGGDAKWPGGWAKRRDPRRVVGGPSGYRTVEVTFTGSIPKPASGRDNRLRLVYQTASTTAVLGSLTVEGGHD